MEIVRFVDQYDVVAPLLRVPPERLRADDASSERFAGRWFATDGGVPVGAVTALVRPDERIFLSFRGEALRLRGPLGATAAKDLARPVHATIDAGDTETLESLVESGFVVEVESEGFVVRFDAALRWLRRGSVPPAFHLIPGDTADRDRLFELDNRLRGDVPGTDGWQGDRTWFDNELSDSPPFDPSGYLVAVHEPSGTYAGLIRFWRNRSGPRLGLIGVLPRFRRTTVAAALLRAGLEAAATWGHETFTTETSLSNRAIHPRLIELGARATGRFVQMALDPATLS